MNIFSKSNSKELSGDLFKNPTSEYRGAPFWAWNTKLSKDILEKQLPIFKEMGFGGYHLHPRTGLDTEYLSNEFMEMVRLCAEYARNNGMKCYGYDEDRFPSGSAGGTVTKNIEYRQRQLVWTKKYDKNILSKRPEGRAKENYYLGKYVISQNEEGFITEYKKINVDEEISEENVRYALIKIAEEDTWFNNQTYVDTMYKPAVDEFIRQTHLRYYNELSEYFGNTIPSFFTDEPKVAYKRVLSDPWDENDIVLPWTDDFSDTFTDRYKFDITEHIPELYLELADNKISKARYYYHRHIMERFCEAFTENIGRWCDEHGVAFAGHMVKEPKLSSQGISAGEVMAPLSSFGFPGIDMLCDAREYTTAKQAQSVKDQYGRQMMLSELYGVTNWSFDFRGHKLGGDWQAALGVNLRVPHLAWMSMKGEAKRDYPASIFYQSPWYEKYKIIEDHFSRINTAMSRGRRNVKIAMIHPVESCWNHWGVKSQTKDSLKKMDDSFKSITEKLLFAQIDFDYISESLLPKQFCGFGENNEIKVGMMEYEVIIIPSCESIRSTTKEILDKWITKGGNVLILKSAPNIMEGASIADRFDFNCYYMVNSEEEMVNALSDYREFKICNQDGSLSDQFLVQSRTDGDDLWYFIANGRRDDSNSAVYNIEMSIEKGGMPYLYDTMSGEIYELDNISPNKNKIRITLELNKHDSALICVKPKKVEDVIKRADKQSGSFEEIAVSNKVPISLSEDNCLILDIAEYYLDGKKDEISNPEEILKIGQSAREKLGIALDGAKMAQPWTKVKKEPLHTITLRYTVNSRVNVFNTYLALEDANVSDVYLNGKQVVKDISGYFVDEAIEKIMLPPIVKGENVIEITLGIGEGTDLEACYLSGDFSVYKDETGYYLDKPVTELEFGSVVEQGLPFYGGNITYYLYYESDGADVIVQADSYKGALIDVESDAEHVGEIIFDPYRLTISDVKSGKHVIGLTLYGNRVNTFGPLHNRLKPLKWVGPESFRTRDFFTYDYVLSEFGIMKKPKLKIKKGSKK